MSPSDDRDERLPRSPLVLSIIGTAALLTFAGLIALGIWQIHRLGWKLDLIARIDSRIHAAAVEAPRPEAWPTVDAERDAYRRVRVEGVFLNDRETLVQAVTVLGGGFWVMTPLRTDQGFTVLVNRGFVPPERRDPASRVAGQVAAPVEVTGLLRITEPNGGFLRSNDPAGDRWYSRDVAAIAGARGLTDVAPYFVDAHAGVPGGPVGGLTVVELPNNHLVYALTWFGLALMVAGGAAYLAREEWRVRRAGCWARRGD